MRGRGAAGNNGGGGGPPPADLLVCFPTRAHLALVMPKPIICSPSRSSDAAKRHPSRSATARTHVASSSPLFRFKTVRNTTTTDDRAPAAVADVAISEPTSPKVTCAGQIKVSRPKTSKLPASTSASGVNKQSWLSVMEEMEGLRHQRRRRGGSGHRWLEALGLKKEAVHLLHGLRGLRLRMRWCFNPAAGCTGARELDQDDSSAGEDDVKEEEEEEEEGKQGDAHQTIFSKWFMVLQEESPSDHDSLERKVIKGEDQLDREEVEEEEEEEREGGFGGCLQVTPSSPFASSSSAPLILQPPPNALLLMRCRSAPSKGCAPDGAAACVLDGAAAAGGARGDPAQVITSPKKMREEEKEKERLLLMSYAPDFFKLSPDIAKETWLQVGSFDPLLRSRSWRR